jgi:hypothetical protein
VGCDDEDSFERDVFMVTVWNLSVAARVSVSLFKGATYNEVLELTMLIQAMFYVATTNFLVG